MPNERVMCAQTGRSELIRKGAITDSYYCSGCGAKLRRPVTYHPTVPERTEGDTNASARRKRRVVRPKR